MIQDEARDDWGPITVPGLKVFLVEDSQLLRTRLRAMLSLIPGLQVIAEAETEAEALAGILAKRPDVVVLDLYLSSGNGLEVLRLVKQTHPEIIVIILTNHDNRQYRERCMALNADYFFDKTKHIEEFLHVLKKLSHAAGESTLEATP